MHMKSFVTATIMDEQDAENFFLWFGGFRKHWRNGIQNLKAVTKGLRCGDKSPSRQRNYN